MGRPHPAFPLPRLSARFADLNHHYDVVVVGSGYGGAIAAARLAAAGQSVCILERGEELHPGEYPSSFATARRAFQLHVKGERVLGSATSLFDFRYGDGISVLVGCGLGGTSLINANVCLEASPWVYQDEAWPRALRVAVGTELRAGIDRARAMLLGPPGQQCAPAKLQKLAMLGREAQALGERARRPPLAVTQVTRRNAAGIEQPACSQCGDCMSGCNTGAKNTVLMNYLPYARKHGAEIFTEIHVDSLERAGDGRWLVRFQRVGSGAGRFHAPPRFVSADVVVLAAGTLGSTEILLRSKKMLRLSSRVGERFSGNGDVLHFAYDCDDPVNGIGLGEERVEDHDPVGPCIGGIIDLRDGRGKDGFVIEDGSPPGAIARLLPIFLGAMSVLESSGRSVFVGGARALWNLLMTLPAKAYDGAVLRTQTHLVMAHDQAHGKLELGDAAELRIHYPGVGKLPIFTRIDETLKRASDGIHGSPIPNPIWDKFSSHPLRRLWSWVVHRYRRNRSEHRDLVTVHPLGGCAMAEDARHGVVNASHQVFSGESGDEVYETLYVMDGSVVPRSLGVNPLLTISGLAERACALLLRDRYGLQLATHSAPRRLWKERHRPNTLGFRFTERLAGHVSDAAGGSRRGLSYAEEKARYEAEARGRTRRHELSLVLDMEIDDIDAFLADPLHEIRVSGTAELPSHFGAPAMVVKGSFARILTRSAERVNTRTMFYSLNVVTEDGRQFLIEGEKWVHDHFQPLRLWWETTRLFVRVSEVATGREVASGIARIGIVDFVKQMLTQRAVRASGMLERLGVRMRFNAFFMGQMVQHANPALAPAERVERAAVRPRRILDTRSIARVHDVKTEDGVTIRLTRYEAGDLGPVLLVHGLGVSSRIFSTDTIRENLLEHLCKRGYDVWLLDYRASTELPEACFRQFTGDDVAKYDYPAAVAHVLEVTRAQSVQMVVHCFGATTFFMSVLGGYLNPGRIRSAVVSQATTHMVTPLGTRLKAGLHLGEVLWWLLGWRLPNAYTDDSATWQGRLRNFALRFWPAGRGELCRNEVCHRISFLYSRLYQHERLNPATHDALHEMFGVANMAALRHLTEMSRQGRIVDADGEDVYVPHMPGRLPFPIRFIHGTENACFKSVGSWISWKLLDELHAANAAANPGPYEWVPIERFGHIDCIFGRDAAEVVFPKISEHLRSH
jgi:cholesterol oxidase